MNDGSITVENAVSILYGVYAELSGNLKINGTTITAHDSTAGNSIGVLADRTALEMISATVTAGEGVGSRGVVVSCVAIDPPTAISNSTITSGTADTTYGLRVIDCDGVSLSGNTITSGEGTGTPVQEPQESGLSFGLFSETSEVSTTDDSIRAGPSSSSSAGVALAGGSLSGTGLDARAGAAGTVSVKRAASVALSMDAAAVSLSGCTLRSGTATNAAEAATSAGLYAADSRPLVNVTDLALIGCDVRSGDADNVSAGVIVDDSCSGCAFSDLDLMTGSAPLTVGLWMTGEASLPAVEVSVTDSRLLVGTASGDDDTSQSVGAWIEGNCGGCTFARNLVQAGDVEGAGVSIGLRWIDYTAIGGVSYVHNNHLRGGAASNATALVISGRAANGLRVLHNNLYGGGRAGSGTASAGVQFGEIRYSVLGTDEVASLGGNIIDAGFGQTRFGVAETCGPTSAPDGEIGGLDNGAARARLMKNTNFWPNTESDGGLVYVRLAGLGGNVCGTAFLTTIDAVNEATTTPYGEVAACGSYSYDEDPEFRDGESINGLVRGGEHLEDDSPMTDKAAHTFGCTAVGRGGPLWAGGAGELGDIDGDTRPFPANEAADIGVDELP
jgi:hypothetical protein